MKLFTIYFQNSWTWPPVSWIRGWEATIVPDDWNRGTGQIGLRASLQPWHSFLNMFAKVASVSWVIPRLGVVLSCESRRPWGVGSGICTANSVDEKSCTLTKIKNLMTSFRFKHGSCDLLPLAIGHLSRKAQTKWDSDRALLKLNSKLSSHHDTSLIVFCPGPVRYSSYSKTLAFISSLTTFFTCCTVNLLQWLPGALYFRHWLTTCSHHQRFILRMNFFLCTSIQLG